MRKLMRIIYRLRYRNEPLKISPKEFDALAAGCTKRLMELGLLKDEPKLAKGATA
jgi:hypothetical protein